MSMNIVITNAGIAEVSSAIESGQTVTLARIDLGTGTRAAEATDTALQSPIAGASFTAVSGGSIGDNRIHITAQDTRTDASYSAFEVGVYTASGTLFARYSQGTAIISKTVSSEIFIALDIVLSQTLAGSVTVGDTNFVLNSATTQREGIVQLATTEEVAAKTNTTKAITPSGLAALIATTSNAGFIEIATSAEVASGSSGTLAVTPATLQAAFAKSLSGSGYQRISNGLIIQWGEALIANGTNGTNVVFPVTFPNRCTSVTAIASGGVFVSYNATLSAGSVVLKHNGNGGVDTRFVAVGY